MTKEVLIKNLKAGAHKLPQGKAEFFIKQLETGSSSVRQVFTAANLMAAEYIGSDPHDMTPGELIDAATYCNSWKNQYCEELCRRTGNLDAYYKNPIPAAKAAAHGFGSELI